MYIVDQETSPERALEFLSSSPFSFGVYKKGDEEPVKIFMVFISFITYEQPDANIDGI